MKFSLLTSYVVSSNKSHLFSSMIVELQDVKRKSITWKGRMGRLSIPNLIKRLMAYFEDRANWDAAWEPRNGAD